MCYNSIWLICIKHLQSINLWIIKVYNETKPALFVACVCAMLWWSSHSVWPKVAADKPNIWQLSNNWLTDWEDCNNWLAENIFTCDWPTWHVTTSRLQFPTVNSDSHTIPIIRLLPTCQLHISGRKVGKRLPNLEIRQKRQKLLTYWTTSENLTNIMNLLNQCVKLALNYYYY